MAVMAAVVVEVFTAAAVASVEASTAVGVLAVPTVVDPTAAITVEHEKVRCMEAVAATGARADFRHRRVISVQRALGRGKAGAGLVTLRLVGMHLQGQATGRAWQGAPAVLRSPAEQVLEAPLMPLLLTATGTPSEAPTVRLDRPWR